MKKLVTILVIAVVLAAIIIISGPFYILNEGEMAVITRFGKIVDVDRNPGLGLKMPFIDNVVRYPDKLLSWDGDAQRIPTKENQFIWVDATARWRISDAEKFYMSVNTTNGAIARLNDILDSTIRTVISENYLNEAVRNSNIINTITVEEDTLQSVDIESQDQLRDLTKTNTVQQEIKIGREGLSNIMLEEAKPLTEVYGIELEDIIIRQIRYSDDLTESVYTRMIKERNQIAEAYRAFGRGQLATWQGKSENDKMTILSEAYSQSEKIKGEADKEASRIYSEAYSKNEEFFRLWTSLESYKKTLIDKDMTITTSSPYFKYFLFSDETL